MSRRGWRVGEDQLLNITIYLHSLSPRIKAMAVTGKPLSRCGKSGHPASGCWCKYLDYRECNRAGHTMFTEKRKGDLRRKQSETMEHEQEEQSELDADRTSSMFYPFHAAAADTD